MADARKRSFEERRFGSFPPFFPVPAPLIDTTRLKADRQEPPKPGRSLTIFSLQLRR